MNLPFPPSGPVPPIPVFHPNIKSLLHAHVVSFLMFFCRKFFMYRKPTNELQEELPGISILKPLVGADPNLQDNLETFFNIAYPKVKVPWNTNSSITSTVLNTITGCCTVTDLSSILTMHTVLYRARANVNTALFVAQHCRITEGDYCSWCAHIHMVL